LKLVVSRSAGSRLESTGWRPPQSVDGVGIAGVKQTTLLVPDSRIVPHPARSHTVAACATAEPMRKNTAGSRSRASIRWRESWIRGPEVRGFAM
jgi:hypothetical protein